MKKPAISAKNLTTLAMLCAIAYALVAVCRIPVVLFLKYEPKDVVIAMGGFMMGPLASLLISTVVSLVEMVAVSDNGFYGLLMNILSTCAFACPAAFIYKKKHTMSGAVTGLVVGSCFMTAAMLLWNYIITPGYMGMPREAVADMLVPYFLPFNLLKSGLNTAFTLLLYKPIVTGLRKVGLLPSPAASNANGKAQIGVWIFAGVLLVTCALFILALQGVI